MSGPLGTQSVEPKVMQVFLAFAQQPGTILSRDDLMATCWNGRIVGDASINRILSLLRATLREVAGEVPWIETIPKVGYRLLTTGEDAEDETQAPATVNEMPESSSRLSGKDRPFPAWTRSLFAAAVLAVAAVTLTAWLARGRDAANTDTLLIAPMTERSDGFFARGFEEEMRRELAHCTGIRIIGNRGMEDPKDNTSSLLELGRRLGAGFVMRGQLVRTGSRIYLDGSVTNAASGEQVWKARVATSQSLVDDLPRRVANEICSALGGGAPPAPAGKRQGIDKSTYSLYLSALGMIRSRDPDRMEDARHVLQTIVARQQTFSEGWSALAKAEFLLASCNAVDDDRKMRLEAAEHARHAITLDAGNAEAHAVLGSLDRTPQLRLQHLRRATELAPDNAEAWLWLANELSQQGRFKQGLDAIIQSHNVDPTWRRSAQASTAADSLGMIDLADRIDQETIQASTDPAQQNMAQAWMALRHGNWTGFVRAADQAAIDGTQGEMFERNRYSLVARAYLGLLPRPKAPPASPAGMTRYILAGQAPTREDLKRSGISPSEFWCYYLGIGITPIIYLNERRGAEMLSLWRNTFATPQEFRDKAHACNGDPLIFVHMAPYLMLASREMQDPLFANLVQTEAVKIVSSTQNQTHVPAGFLVDQARLAAVSGDRKTAIEKLESGIRQGWPQVDMITQAPFIGTLFDDPAFSAIANDPRFRGLALKLATDRERARASLSAPLQ
ncbi:winged helix-turn-helix domain-containing protein [Novosphingobium malaysiense]|nr:winged helix-turn-helix domain-containing protein [Novosphingobium malaysiense]